METPAPALATSVANSHVNRLNLAHFPVELLTMIVLGVVAISSMEDDRPSSPERDAPWGRSALIALSEVNSFFFSKCAPHIWETVSFIDKSNFHYLYFIKFILPRHGNLVRALHDVEFNTERTLGQERVPKYVAQALGVSSRLGHPSSSASATQPLDVELLGEELLLPSDLPSGDPVGDKHRTKMIDQRTTLFATIIASPHLLRLDSLSLQLTTTYSCVVQIFFAIHTSLLANLGSRPRYLDINYGCTRSPPEDDDVRILHIRGVQATQRGLAALLNACPGVEELILGIPATDNLFDGDRVLLKALQRLDKLEHLHLNGLFLEGSWLTGTWSAKLKSVTLTDLINTEPEDVIDFLGQFESTVNEVHLNFFHLEDAEEFPPVSDPRKYTFPKVTKLSVTEGMPDDFLECFRLSPLEDLNVTRLGGLLKVEWDAIFKDHGSTLKRIKAPRGTASGEQVKEEMEKAAKHGIDLHLRPAPHGYESESKIRIDRARRELEGSLAVQARTGA